MTVHELIELLEDMNPNASVKVAVQPNYPMEADFYGVVEEGDDVWLAVGDNRSYDVPRDLHAAAERGWS
jgi:hypothetical protein